MLVVSDVGSQDQAGIELISLRPTAAARRRLELRSRIQPSQRRNEQSRDLRRKPRRPDPTRRAPVTPVTTPAPPVTVTVPPPQISHVHVNVNHSLGTAQPCRCTGWQSPAYMQSLSIATRLDASGPVETGHLADYNPTIAAAWGTRPCAALLDQPLPLPALPAYLVTCLPPLRLRPAQQNALHCADVCQEQATQEAIVRRGVAADMCLLPAGADDLVKFQWAPEHLHSASCTQPRLHPENDVG
jgi:hypothetical protein